MMNLDISCQITFLYYSDLCEAQVFFEQTLGLDLVEDQVWAKIYRVADDAYLGIVDESKGTLAAHPEISTLITLVVDDVDSWYERLQEREVTIIRELVTFEDIQVRSFFFEGPGGYKFEIQEFLDPKAREIFHV